jgi:thiosulfate reductase cytochrome b subunit
MERDQPYSLDTSQEIDYRGCHAGTRTMANATHGGAAIARPKQPVHPAYVRVTHWINAVAIVAMIGSGWEMYNASPLFPFVSPKGITLGGWLAGALLSHFPAMWLLVANGVVYAILGDGSLSAQAAADPAGRFHSRSARGALRPAHSRQVRAGD